MAHRPWLRENSPATRENQGMESFILRPAFLTTYKSKTGSGAESVRQGKNWIINEVTCLLFLEGCRVTNLHFPKFPCKHTHPTPFPPFLSDFDPATSMDSDIFLVRLEVVEFQSLSPVLFDGNGYEALTGVVKVVGPRLCIFTDWLPLVAGMISWNQGPNF